MGSDGGGVGLGQLVEGGVERRDGGGGGVGEEVWDGDGRRVVKGLEEKENVRRIIWKDKRVKYG